MSTELVRIGEIARWTGQGEATIRAWERRYGWPTPTRTAGGHRLYPKSTAAEINRVVDLTLAGMRVPAAVATVAGRGSAPAATDARIVELEGQVQALTAELARVRRAMAEALAPVDVRASRGSVPDLTGGVDAVDYVRAFRDDDVFDGEIHDPDDPDPALTAVYDDMSPGA